MTPAKRKEMSSTNNMFADFWIFIPNLSLLQCRVMPYISIKNSPWLYALMVVILGTKSNCRLTNNQFAPFDVLEMLFTKPLYTHSCNIQRDKLLWPIKFLKGSVIFSKREKNHCGMSYN